MKNFIVALWLLFTCANAFALHVTGTGRNFEEAKQNAFSTAIDFYAGTVVVTERELNNYKLVKNEILVYSSGYIDGYKIISETIVNGQVRLVLDVKVNSNKISNRILGSSSNTSVIEGDRIQTQISTYREERTRADRLLGVVLNDYPYRAYNLEQKQYRIQVVNREPLLVIPYKLTWNYNYVMALNEVLSKVQDGEIGILSRPTSIITTIIKDTNDFNLGRMRKFGFNDMTHPDMIAAKFHDSEVRVMALINNRQNQTVWYICHHPLFLSGRGSFYGIGDMKNMIVLGNALENGEVRLLIQPELYKILHEGFTIKLQIVKHSEC